MGRKKSRPIRSGGLSGGLSETRNPSKLENSDDVEAMDASCNQESMKPFYISVDQSHWDSDEHFDVAELILNDVKFANDGLFDSYLGADNFEGTNFSLRFCLCGVEERSFRLGQWPILPTYNLILECVAPEGLFFSGIFDGPDESVSGLVHLVSQKLMSLRLVPEIASSGNVPPFRVRVEIMQTFFDACGSLLEVARQPWRKSMMNVMSWIRPEVMTSEARYGNYRPGMQGADSNPESMGGSSSTNSSGFDANDFYEAIKPSKEEPMLENELPDLLPQLRPYQRRAVYWMVQREKCIAKSSGGQMQNQRSAPFCIPVVFLERHSRMFYNPFNGSVSLLPEFSAASYVSGGILADEMGLGKTVELLACIFAHRKPSLEDGMVPHDDSDLGIRLKGRKRERVECICGAASENYKYEGLWVQCDICDAWQHADCVGYSPKKKPLVSHEVYKRKSIQSKYHSRKNGCSSVVEIDGTFICSLCSELIEAAESMIYAVATLIVCPAPILAQWHSEIVRHTGPGSLKICIYEGARNLASAATLRTYMSELAGADIVLTTYDVLKEDLSHDSDRHDGDRRFMRFQKRYPVVPTLLTRIHWWRLCLDEAQMVECNTANVTEMAMRLHADHHWCITGTPIQRRLDDMYGLLRFLRASPYDVYKWWVEVVRDPYEKRDMEAMKFVHGFFKQIMWRSSKLHVSEELQLPPQRECVSWLTFSPVEEHFYKKQHETCVGHAHEIIQSLKDNFRKRNFKSGYDASHVVLSHNEVARLLFPLLKLRQACCHPQVGGSALCSLQHSPLTMEEILEVLIGKTKIEGEEALRRIVVAVNGLAGLAIIEEDNKQAVALYNEALDLAEKNLDDFCVDPLLSLHIHHNLAELLTVTFEERQQCPLLGAHHSDNNDENKDLHSAGKFSKHYVKRRKINDNEDNSAEHHFRHQVPSRCYADACLRRACESIKQKFLSVFISRLSLAQQEFKNSYTQVCTLSKECQNLGMTWWLHAFDIIEQNKDSSGELIKKIDEAVSRVGSNSKSLKNSSSFRSISGLKYGLQTGLDLLQTSRKALLDRLMEIDLTMEKPKDSDIECVGYCPICGNGDGPLCVHCELNDLFQVYEARLFLMTKGNNGVLVTVEEALDLQKQKTELNRFFRDSKTSIDSNTGESKQRHVKENVQVSRRPSMFEITLGVVKNFLKAKLGRHGLASAVKHLLLLEAMRKEFAQARSLSFAQAQFLGAHAEIKWSTSRLRLRLTEDEPTATNILSKEQLIPSSMQFSSDKFLASSLLERIKGQLRYLKGLVSKQKTQHKDLDLASSHQYTTTSLAREETGYASKPDDEPCPICHENFWYQKMVFQCGHVICCKCCLQLTEQAVGRNGKSQLDWLMCPTCRQRTNIENIAYVDDRHNNGSDMMTSNASQDEDFSESSVPVRGSYGTKIEAITRRILWITSRDQGAKVLVFSSWNDVLDVLQHALDANNITHVRMKGGRKAQFAITRFKQQSPVGPKIKEQPAKSFPVQVLLILIQHGANGLNLLEAQHVILVEPQLNPASEAQAISRVHRIGQEKQTIVYRFIVKKTVEESIYTLNRSRTSSSIMGVKTKHQEHPALTIRDVESLFASTSTSSPTEEIDAASGSLGHLPPSVASAIAAERRLAESNSRSL